MQGGEVAKTTLRNVLRESFSIQISHYLPIGRTENNRENNMAETMKDLNNSYFCFLFWCWGITTLVVTIHWILSTEQVTNL